MWKKIKEEKTILIVVIILIIIPIIFIDSWLLKEIGKGIYNNIDFWTSYMTYAGTIILGAVTLIQNSRLHNRNNELEVMNKELMRIEKAQYAPQLLLTNEEQINTRKENKDDLKSYSNNIIYPQYNKEFMSDCTTYIYRLKLSENSNKSIRLRFMYSGKGICNNIKICSIKVNNENTDINQNIKMSFIDKATMYLSLFYYQEENNLKSIDIDLELSIIGKSESYKEKIKIEFIKIDGIKDDLLYFINSINYDNKEGEIVNG